MFKLEFLEADSISIFVDVRTELCDGIARRANVKH